MDVSLKSSVNSSVAAHTGYSWKGLPPDLRGPTISINPHGRNHQVHSDNIRPTASSREQRTDQWLQRQGKNPDGFPGPPAASGPNWRQGQPFGIGDRAPIPAARPTHIRQGPSYEARWKNTESENDSGFSSPGPRQPQLEGPEWGRLGVFRQGQDVPPSSDFRSLHGTYDNSWYSPSPPPYCAHAESDVASYLSIEPETVTFQNKDVSNYPRGTRSFDPLPPVPEGSGRKVDEVTRTSNTTALKTSWRSSDPQPTGKRSPRKRCIRIIVVVVLAAVIASVVTALEFYFLKKDDGPVPPKPTVKPAFLKEPAVMEFKMAEPASVDQLEILREEDHLFYLNVTGNTTDFPAGQRMRVDIRISTDSLTVTLTLMNATCIDEGSYVVIARGKEREERKAVVLKVSRRPHFPVLEVPEYIVESRTTDNPVCRVSSLGYPPLKLVWLLRRPGESEQTLQASQLISADADTCQSAGNSTLKAQGYTGWNNSDICCQMKEPKSSEVYFESCRRILTVPADVCTNGDGYQLYPYEPCYTYVQCQSKKARFDTCQNGYCFNLTSQNCSVPAPALQPNRVADPFSCSEQKAAYIPSKDTYPNNCHTYQRCAGDKAVPKSCDSGLEFTYDKNGDQDVVCGPLSNATYCGKRFLLENATVIPMENHTGHIGRNVSVKCEVTHVTRLSVVKFLRNDTELTRLNVTDSSVTSSRDNVALAGEERGEGREKRFVAVLTMSNLSCSDGGQYVCVAEDGDHEARQTTTLLITRDPEAPTLEIPDKLIEFRTSANPRCVASSLGYNPGMHFAWMLRRPGGQEEELEQSRHNDRHSISPLVCDSTGNSDLDAQNYVTWNDSDLCCQLINTTNNNSVVKETCKKLEVLSAVEMDSDPVADIDKPYSLRCLARNVSGDAQVKFHHKDQLLASFNTSALSGDADASDISIGGRLDGDMLTVTLSFTMITCADGGNYTCSVNDSGVDTSATVRLAIRRPPTEPILKVPDAVEGVTDGNPTCRVTSLGYYPVMTLTWVLKKPDGNEETKATYGSNSTDVTVYDDTCNSTIAETTLNANRYSGWNNSRLCCQVTDPLTSTVVKEKCQLMLLVPGGYCNDDNKNRLHPYDPCGKWVQCPNGIPFINTCGGTGLCYNIVNDACA